MLGIKRQAATRSVIGAGMRVQGPCSFQGELTVDGSVVGDVQAEPGQPSVLIVGEGGSIQGAISADQVVIGGTVVGPVLARELLELQSGARVQGDVRYKSLEMHQGAVIAGQLQPQLTPPPQASESPGERSEAPAAEPEWREPTEPTLDPDRP